MIEINVTFAYQLINLFIMIFFLNYFLFKPIMEVVERRNAKLKSFTTDTAKFRQKSENAVKGYDEKMTELKKTTAAILAAARQKTAAEHERIIRESRAKFTEQIKTARAGIKKESDKTALTLRKEADKISRDIASRLLGRRAG